jgi:hypothetical protein
LKLDVFLRIISEKKIMNSLPLGHVKRNDELAHD